MAWDPEASPNPGESFFDPEVSAWFNACTNAGKSEPPLEGGIESGKCVPTIPQAKTFSTVESQPECHSDVPPFDQVLGLWGGVREWQDFCGESGCSIGGAKPTNTDQSPTQTCKDMNSRTGPSEDVGFRCCLPLASP